MRFEPTRIFDLVAIIILTTFVIAVLLFWLYRVMTTRHKLYVVLEIGDHSQSVRVNCMVLTSVIYSYQFLAPEYIKSLSTVGYCPAYLLVEWPSFSAIHIAGDTPIEFPRKIPIPPWTKRRIERILHSSSFYVLALLRYHGHFRLIDFDSELASTDRAVFIGEGDTADDQANPSSDAVTPPVPLCLYTPMSPLPISE